MFAKEFKLYWFGFLFILVISIFFRIKIIHELPLGTEKTSYGLKGFDDEPSHFNFTKYLIDNHNLPVLVNKVTDPDAFQINEFEYHQPPLYYLLVAGISEISDVQSAGYILLIGRYFSFLLFLLSLGILFGIFKNIGWQYPEILLALSIFCFLGSNVYQFSLFSNDGLSWFLMWATLYLVIKGFTKNFLVLIVILTLSHYTKSNILVYYPIFIWAAVKEIRELPHSTTYLKIAAVFIVPVLLTLPWYWRNYILYGHFFSISLITGDTWYFVSTLKESVIKLLHMPYSFLFRMHFEPPKPVLSLFNIVPYIWCVVAGLHWLSGIKKKLKDSYNFQLLSILLISMGVAFVRYAIPTGYTEARALYPAMPVFLFLMTSSIYSLHTKYNIPKEILFGIVFIVFLPSFIIGFFF